MKKCITLIGMVTLITLSVQAENIDIAFEKPKVIDVFKKDKKQKHSIDGVCKYPKTAKSYEKLANILAGHWSALNQAGFVTVRGMTIPLPAETTPQTGFVLYVQSGELVVNPPNGDTMVLKFATEKGWKFDKKKYYKDFLGSKVKKEISPGMTSEDIGLLVDCDPNDLPRLVGKTTFNVNGTLMHATYRFIALTDSIMYGIMHYTGMAPGGISYDAKRSFSFMRD